jgi:hypothetical protein
LDLKNLLLVLPDICNYFYGVGSGRNFGGVRGQRVFKPNVEYSDIVKAQVKVPMNMLLEPTF